MQKKHWHLFATKFPEGWWQTPTNRLGEIISLLFYKPTLHQLAQVNDSLIRGVFDEIVKFRPALAKYLIADEDA